MNDGLRCAARFVLAVSILGETLVAQDAPFPASAALPFEPALPFASVPTPASPVPDDASGRGLLDFRDPFPLAKLHLQLPTTTPRGLKERETSGLVHFDWANTSEDESEYLVDAETYTLRLGVWHALFRNLYLGADVAVEARDRGALDSFIDGFHDTFGINVSEREKLPTNGYDVAVAGRDGGLTDLDRGFGFGNTTLKAHWIFAEAREDDWWPTLSLQPLVYLPTSTSGFGGRGIDLGLALGVQKKVCDHLYLYTVGGVTYLTDPTTEGLRYEEFNYQVTVGFEVVLWWDSVSLAFQYSHYSPLLKDPGRLGWARNYIGGAIKHRIHPRVDVIWGFIENLPPLENTADVTFSMGCELRF